MEAGLIRQHRSWTDMQADFAGRLKALDVDTNLEEHRLRGIVGELVRFAKKVGDPTSSIQLTNSVLEVSVTEWQALISEYPEKSFRADLNRVLRRAVGVLASMQEEASLYGARTGESLHKKRIQRFLYLAYTATQILPELEELEKQARSRGLFTKAEHLQDAIARLHQYCEQVLEISIESLK